MLICISSALNNNNNKRHLITSHTHTHNSSRMMSQTGQQRLLWAEKVSVCLLVSNRSIIILKIYIYINAATNTELQQWGLGQFQASPGVLEGVSGDPGSSQERGTDKLCILRLLLMPVKIQNQTMYVTVKRYPIIHCRFPLISPFTKISTYAGQVNSGIWVCLSMFDRKLY